MARIACALLFVVLLGVCPVLAPGGAGNDVRAGDGAAPAGRARQNRMDVPHAASPRPRRFPDVRSKRRPVIRSRDMSSAAWLALTPPRLAPLAPAPALAPIARL